MEITIEEIDEIRRKTEEDMDILFYYKVKKMVDEGYTAHGILQMLTTFSPITGKRRETLHPIMEDWLNRSETRKDPAMIINKEESE